MTTAPPNRDMAGSDPAAGGGLYTRLHDDAAGSCRLGSDEVHLWYAAAGRAQTPAPMKAYESLLSVDELARMRRFVDSRDRQTFLVSHALLRATLSRYLPVRAHHWRFVTGEKGKPRIAADQGCATGVEFSLSHTRGFAVLGVARGREIGVDVECLRRQFDLSVAEDFFAADEVAALRAADAAAQQELFVGLWTLKESYLKATGAGLSTALDTISFRCEAEKVIATGPRDAADRWSFWQFRPTVDHLCSLCVQASRDQVIRLRVMGCLPLCNEWLAGWPVTRTSRAGR